MTRGILLFAFNNAQIDYAQQALITALMIKRNMREHNVTLVTEEGSIRYLKTQHSKKLIDYAFDHIISLPWLDAKGNVRVYRGGNTNSPLDFRNTNRSRAFDLSPYDETLLIDTDYFVLDDSLDLCWDSVNEVMMNKQIRLLNSTRGYGHDIRLDTMGIPTYWATVMYFKKTKFVQSIFNMVEHIRDHYDFYQYVYRFPGRFFRNDFAFSIAFHMLSGFVENGNFVQPLPVPYVYTSIDSDTILEVKGMNDLLFRTFIDSEPKPVPVRVRDMNVHCMNKYAISAHAKHLISLYGADHGAK